MSNSLEIRVPMLDRQVIDTVSSWPGSVRLPRGVANKTLLRKAFAEHLPVEVTQQRKRGFVFPLARWMAGPLRERCEAALESLERAGVCERAGIRHVWESYLSAPETQNWSRAWTLCVLGDWLARNVPAAADQTDAHPTVAVL